MYVNEWIIPNLTFAYLVLLLIALGQVVPDKF